MIVILADKMEERQKITMNCVKIAFIFADKRNDGS